MFDAEVSGFDETQGSLDSATDTIVASTKEGTRAYAEFLLKRIQETAPVETGEYKNDWRIEQRMIEGDKVTVIVNTTDHGPYLVFPNQTMVGSESADDPARGIIHNVRGIVKDAENDYEDSMIDILKDLLS